MKRFLLALSVLALVGAGAANAYAAGIDAQSVILNFHRATDSMHFPLSTPEPVSMMLIGSGLMGIGLVGRSRRAGSKPTR
jgi:hypothetical protein